MTRVIETKEVRIEMADGTRTAVDIVAPQGDPRPTLLIRTPYGRSHDRLEYDPIGLARLGWNVVIQDTRGTGDSEGKFDPFVQEIADGAETVKWCRAQPFSNGRVATMGRSYVGATAVLAAAHSKVDACSPQLTAGDIRDGWNYEGGVLRTGFVLPWACGFAGSRSPAGERLALEMVADPLAMLARKRFSTRLAKAFPPYAHWADRADAAYWNRISALRKASRMDTPMFHVAGWFDIFCEGSIALYERMRTSGASERARRSQRLLVGPWTHVEVFGSQTSEMDFGLAANGILADTPTQIARWLLDAADGRDVEGGARVFVMGQNRWLDLASWPPPSKAKRLFLAEEEQLLSQPQETAGKVHISHDPKDPVSSKGGRSLGPVLPFAGPMDQLAMLKRADVASFCTPPLQREVTIAGMVRASIVVSTAASSADVHVKLVDVHPDGKAMSVIDSVRRLSVTAGRARAFDVEVGSVAMSFAKGHRIRIDVAGSNFPRLDVNPERAIHSVLLGGARPSFVDLPTVRPDL